MIFQLDFSSDAFDKALQRLRDKSQMDKAGQIMQDQKAAINKDLQRTVLREVPAFSESKNPSVLSDLVEHGDRHTEEIIRLLRGGKIGDFGFVADHARKRAEQRFPLEASLHAYRCGHKVFSKWMRQATLASLKEATERQQIVADIADFAIEYTDAVSSILTRVYVEQTRLLAELFGDQRSELIRSLLKGCDESDGRVSRLLKESGFIGDRQSFCVALTQPVDVTEMLNPARARRLALAIEKTLVVSRLASLVEVRKNKVVMIVSHTHRVSGWSEPRKSLADRLKRELLAIGNNVLTGISRDVRSTAMIPNACREAELALDLANVSRRVVMLSELQVRDLLLSLNRDRISAILPAWATKLSQADQKSRGALVKTLRVCAQSNMNVLKTARDLAVHPNTVYARLTKVYELTGQDPRTFDGLLELLLVADFHGS